MASGYLTLKALVSTYIVALPERVPHYTTFRTITGRIKIHGKKKTISQESTGFIFSRSPVWGWKQGTSARAL